MKLKFCTAHHNGLMRALTTRGLSEFGWRTDSERIEALTEQGKGHYSRKNFNPFIIAMLQIFELAGREFGNDAEGCPVCLLGSETIITKTADRMLQTIQSLPDE